MRDEPNKLDDPKFNLKAYPNVECTCRAYHGHSEPCHFVVRNYMIRISDRLAYPIIIEFYFEIFTSRTLLTHIASINAPIRVVPDRSQKQHYRPKRQGNVPLDVPKYITIAVWVCWIAEVAGAAGGKRGEEYFICMWILTAVCSLRES
jgi:hypothetical protein